MSREFYVVKGVCREHERRASIVAAVYVCRDAVAVRRNVWRTVARVDEEIFLSQRRVYRGFTSVFIFVGYQESLAKKRV